MKKLPSILFLSLLISLFSLSMVHALATVPGPVSLDPTAYYVASVRNKYWSTKDDGMLCQSFKVTRAGLAKYVDLNAAGSSTTGITMRVYVNTGGNPLGDLVQTYYPPATFQDGRNTMTRFTTSEPASVTAGGYYWLCMYAERGSDAYWYSDDPTGTYTDGFAMVNQVGYFQTDFGFKIYSFDWVIPNPEVNQPDPVVPDPGTPTPDPVVVNPTPAAETPLPTGVTEGSNAAPAATTTAIKPATTLTAVDVPDDQGGSILLNWKASATTDITGYKVFRSTSESTNTFKEIAKAEKTILTFTDHTAEIGQQYFYMVRAYKTTLESVNSNIVKATSVDNIAPAVPVNFVYVDDSETSKTFTWNGNTDADLQGYTLLITSNDDPTVVIKSFVIPKGTNSYALDYTQVKELNKDTTYGFYLVATDTNTNTSEKATVKGAETVVEEPKIIAIGATDVKTINPILWYIGGGTLLLIIASVGGALYYFKAKKGKLPTKGLETPEIKPETPIPPVV